MREPTSDPSVSVVRIAAFVTRDPLPPEPHSEEIGEDECRVWKLQPSDVRAGIDGLPRMSHVGHEDCKVADDGHVSKHAVDDRVGVDLIV